VCVHAAARSLAAKLSAARAPHGKQALAVAALSTAAAHHQAQQLAP
jgi:hypothetical protein